MADLKFNATVGEVSVTSTAKTFILATGPTNQRIKLLGLQIFGKGTSNTDTPVKCEIIVAASITGGTAGTAPTTKVRDTDQGETIQTALTGNYSAEPTYNTSTVIETYEVHPQTGLMVFYPLNNEIKLKGGQVLALRMTSNQNETMSATLIFEE